MGRSFGFLGILVVLAVGGYLYTRQIKAVSPDNAAHSPQLTIDTVGVRNDLVAMAEAEKRHFALDNKYVSIDELRSSGDISLPRNRRGPYAYDAEVNGASFRITATYDGPDNPGAPKSFSIDDTMEVKTQ